MVRKVKRLELLRGVRVRPYMLRILMENDCSMDREKLIDKVVDEVYKRYCIKYPDDKRENCREEAYEKAKTCLRDALADGVVLVTGNKIILPRCIHMKEVSKSLKILLYTLEYVPFTKLHIPQVDIESERFQLYLHKCHDYLEYLRHKDIDVEIVKDIEDLLKILLEHLITSKLFTMELLSNVIRKENHHVVLDLASEAALKLKSMLSELRSEEAVQRMLTEGCCKKCVNLGLCSRCDVDRDIIEIVEVFIKMLLGAACKFITPKFEVV